jgi:hypothetical protein
VRSEGGGGSEGGGSGSQGAEMAQTMYAHMNKKRIKASMNYKKMETFY